ncbi:hypothetical protein GLAREA_00143 [Glarea lozoyensis ATCC 20868]|uniref:Uncharacterized protein n=1 Tax=Glarea lozoyensis (strain ATCC 20868 / MF5171) TaxID=1116229 RepID=S3CTJ5_GLAL2|nr:uncharacterized protein GLAREA_00143 [Glarea lozoyensis ATCC 20868]EPE28985.1 hypothetical protein GLAREA_00143 [Glarea lozoyensis ATCC 20868]
MPKTPFFTKRKSKHQNVFHPYKRSSRRSSNMDQLLPAPKADTGKWRYWRRDVNKQQLSKQSNFNSNNNQSSIYSQNIGVIYENLATETQREFVYHRATAVRMQRSFSGNLSLNLNVIAEDDVVSTQSHLSFLSGTTAQITTQQEATIMAYPPRKSGRLVNSISLQQLKSPPLLRSSPPLHRNMVSPTRIPSPTDAKGRTRTLRYVTAPAVMTGDRKEVRNSFGGL